MIWVFLWVWVLLANRRPTTDDRRPTTDDRRPTTAYGLTATK
jgi:hypothetical protein